MSRLLALLLLTSLAPGVADGSLPFTPGDPSPEPTEEETLTLELINRYRADPKAEARRLAERPWPREPYEGLDIDVFVAEMDELLPAQPLVFHPLLIGASRNHLAYTPEARHYGHQEREGHPAYTGEWPSERAAFVGYDQAEGKVAECAGAYSHGGLLGSHWGYLVDDGPGGDHGMQAGRGHRMALIAPHYREYGAATEPHPDGRWGSSMLCAPSAVRLVGGVAYLDLDGDAFYDLGEGLGDLPIEVVGGAGVRTWASGAYRLEAGGGDALELRASFLDLVVEDHAPAENANHKFDVELIGPALEYWADLRERMGGRNRTKARRALQDLAVWAEALAQLVGPAALTEAEEAAVADELTVWAGLRDEALDRLVAGSADRKALRQRADDLRGTLQGSWFELAADLQALAEDRRALEASQGNARTKRRALDKLRESAADLEERVDRSDLRELLQAELLRIGALERGPGSE